MESQLMRDNASTPMFSLVVVRLLSRTRTSSAAMRTVRLSPKSMGCAPVGIRMTAQLERSAAWPQNTPRFLERLCKLLIQPLISQPPALLLSSVVSATATASAAVIREMYMNLVATNAAASTAFNRLTFPAHATSRPTASLNNSQSNPAPIISPAAFKRQLPLLRE